MATIGVYLFHTHPGLFTFIWSELEVKFREETSVAVALSLILIESLIVFGLGTLIELVRGVLLDRCRKLKRGGVEADEKVEMACHKGPFGVYSGDFANYNDVSMEIASYN